MNSERLFFISESGALVIFFRALLAIDLRPPLIPSPGQSRPFQLQNRTLSNRRFSADIGVVISFILLNRLLLSFVGSCVRWILSSSRTVARRRAFNDLKSSAP